MKIDITNQVKDEFLISLKTLISYPSVLNEGENGTPFGQAIQDVLEKTLEICRDIGFTTYLDPKSYYGYAEIGQGAELLAILCHLDVVPSGDEADWQAPPFEATIKDGWVFGRGVQDDKGPSLAALYAVKSLLDQGIQFKKRVRFIFGTDEETLWRCMARYNTIEEQASMGFAPDSSFPLTYAEKGLLQVKLHGPGSDQLELEVGDAFNVVPDKANYQGPLYEQVCNGLKEAGYDYQTTEQTVTVLGVPKHAKDASQGINAVIRLATILAPLQEHPALSFLATQAGQDGTGRQIFGDIADEPSGHLSFNVAGLMINHERSEIRIDIRTPVLTDKEELVELLTRCAQNYQLRYEEFDYLASLYVAKDSKLVSTLMQIYQEKTGDNSPAISSGGATFARTMPNCVAFGALFPGAKQTEHQANECAVLEDLYRAMDIYAEAVYRLAT
ncbi:ArcT [Streptococcus pneumoniae]|uniref:dipeptidase n=1 Tax=Streptococcus pneumoniae TaxID=1313 RepID=UPI0005E8D1AC|nr:dipeptidase [Streptococcus pneumoniae]CTL84526.1 Acetylornithine deacetylase/Succinyl-diaminopimelate desuccinylase-like deacylases [Streptococcus pneumoniae]CTM31134.1 Acetylornithine deacetylase/Succinyl-diaminopimelate desuccinylase-like deacylases [Streptococcus pneumoniae]CTM46809.1 Acetylornithine deacetylase/Succinyl-diaminopimelate desuccinylase-like deacylases [Streptococcus pneumoniae]VKT07665.1 ArcT [Streptococcus pneumoniae]VKV02508.1 ArcT [Streptococcus pneumoniae]